MNNIRFVGYGRARRGASWYIAPIGGVNRLWYLHSGCVRFRSGEKERLLTAGHFYLFPENLPFSLLTDENTDVDHTFFDFFSLPPLVMDDVLEIGEEDALLSMAGRLLVELAPKAKEKYHFLLSSYMENYLSLARGECAFYCTTDEVVDEAVAYIHSHFRENISVELLARKYHLEKSVFIRRFKRRMGTTPYQYLKSHRVNYAVSLICMEGYSLGDVAQMTGYADQSTLSHAVKSVFGRYPAEMKKEKSDRSLHF